MDSADHNLFLTLIITRLSILMKLFKSLRFLHNNFPWDNILYDYKTND
jgi:hypothetical protein